MKRLLAVSASLFAASVANAQPFFPAIGDHVRYSCTGDLVATGEVKVVGVDERGERLNVTGDIRLQGINKDSGETVDRTITVARISDEYLLQATKKGEGWQVLNWFGSTWVSLIEGQSAVYFESKGARHDLTCNVTLVPLPPEIACRQIDSDNTETLHGKRFTVSGRGYGDQIGTVMDYTGKEIFSSVVRRAVVLDEKRNLLRFIGEEQLLSVDMDSSMLYAEDQRKYALLRSTRTDLGIGGLRMVCTIDRELH